MARGRATAAVRRWFEAQGFVEVETAALQVSPGNEPHLHAFSTEAVGPGGDRAPLHLRTSPEFAAKKLLAAGEPGHRISLPNARIMVHQPSGGFRGQASDIERHAEDIIKTKRRLNELYAKHTGKAVEDIERALDRDNFLSAEEAKTFGLVDHVYERRDLVEAS